MATLAEEIFDFFVEDGRMRAERARQREWLRGRIREYFDLEIQRYREESGDDREIPAEQMAEMVERRVREEMGEED